jgi:SAM-dependent methyltransferase
MHDQEHWEGIYSSKPADSVSWFQNHAETSLRLILHSGIPRSAAVIDAGGGASTLVDDLLSAGYTDLTVLDLSSSALEASRKRLGKTARQVKWLQGDLLRTSLPRQVFDLWHDRAVFHFLGTPEERKAYAENVLRSVKPGGYLVIATFADDGPERCSGLPVMRYGHEALAAVFGSGFSLLLHEREAHTTPEGVVQQFLYCLFRKAAQ